MLELTACGETDNKQACEYSPVCPMGTPALELGEAEQSRSKGLGAAVREAPLRGRNLGVHLEDVREQLCLEEGHFG